MVRRGAVSGAVLLATAVIAGCGGQDGRLAGAATPAASAPSSAVTATCGHTSVPPEASRLATPVGYGDIRLTVVDPEVRPRVPASAAYARIVAEYQPSPHSCGFSEVLAYWSSPSPAKIPAPECVATTTHSAPWPPPASCAPIPLYSHVLAWVFTWREDCGPPSGPAPAPGTTLAPLPSLPPLACRAVTLVDATTGTPGVLEEGRF